MTHPIAVQDLRVYYGRLRALWNVSFTVEAGAFVTVLGPNGSGKSTLLKALLGLVPAEGTVRLLDDAPETRSEVAYVPQIKTLDRSFPALAHELVLSGLHHRWPGRRAARHRDKVMEALERVGAAGLADRPLRMLSGGELQRVYLARGLVRSPQVILLDEPATGIDVVGASNLYDVLAAYQKATGATVVMVTHDWEVAYHHATDVLLLSGEQIAYGPPREALTDACLRKAFGHIGHAHAMLLGGGHSHGGGHDHA